MTQSPLTWQIAGRGKGWQVFTLKHSLAGLALMVEKLDRGQHVGMHETLPNSYLPLL